MFDWNCVMGSWKFSVKKNFPLPKADLSKPMYFMESISKEKSITEFQCYKKPKKSSEVK